MVIFGGLEVIYVAMSLFCSNWSKMSRSVEIFIYLIMANRYRGTLKIALSNSLLNLY